ncbi:MAG TPA: MFS transporter [Rhodanobacter sp.]|nr:MFS transporter [Rhodanobacter sp.]
MRQHHAIIVLGAGQCVYWGVLYYAFAVLQLPLAATLNASPAQIAGAYSIGLAITGLTAPIIGRWLDRGASVALMRCGSLMAGGLLLAWSWVTTLPALYVIWVGLGATLATLLYEPAFALVREVISDNHARARAIATVTILGGLASTLFLPLTASLVSRMEWQNTLRTLAGLVLISSVVVDRFALRPLVAHRIHAEGLSETASVVALVRESRILPPGFWQLRAVFFCSTLASMALTVQLIPTLVERGNSASLAAGVLALLGIMQLPGRIFVLSGRTLPGAAWLLALPLLLQAAGLLLLVFKAPLVAAFIGMSVFGIGAGLNTLARPLVIQALYGCMNAGRLNGDLARAQHIARAIGPISISLVYLWGGPIFAFGGVAFLLAALASMMGLKPVIPSVELERSA